MKKYFEYIGLLSLTLFSFYYTDKVTNIMNSKDPVMVSINEYKIKDETCKEGYVTNDGVVLGKDGKEVNAEESYSNMQGAGFNEELLVYDKVVCKVNLESSKNNYIINASPSKNMVSLFIEIDNLENIDDILKIAKSKGVKLNVLVDGETIEKNKKFFNDIYNKGYEIVYGGSSKEDLKIFLKTIKDYDKNYKTYCMSIDNKNMDFCSTESLIKLRSSYYYTNNIYVNTKNNLEKGSFYIYKENNKTLEEISTIINFIRAKNIDIKPISDILK